MIPPRVNVDIVRERIGTYADKQHTAEERFAIYRELIGFLPPRIEARINVTGALDPEFDTEAGFGHLLAVMDGIVSGRIHLDAHGRDKAGAPVTDEPPLAL